MRIATWNMDHWQRSATLRLEAWDFLQTRVRADIALVQEALPSKEFNQVVFRQGGIYDDRKSTPKNLGWGSAVISFGPQIRAIDKATSPFRPDPIPLMRTFPGAVAIAEIIGEPSIVVVSAYGVIDRGYAAETVHRILSDITPLIDERRGRNIIVAGDLNITTQWSAKHRSFLHGLHDECLRRDSNLFERFTALGFHNVVSRAESTPLDGCECSLGQECRHVRTQRHTRSKFPWQNDYIFVSENLLSRSHRVEVIDEEAAWRLSGHCPIVLELSDL